MARRNGQAASIALDLAPICLAEREFRFLLLEFQSQLIDSDIRPSKDTRNPTDRVTSACQVGDVHLRVASTGLRAPRGSAGGVTLIG